MNQDTLNALTAAFGTNSEAVIEALGEGPDLTGREVELLTIILNPENDPYNCRGDIEFLLDDLSGYGGSWDFADAQRIAGMLKADDARRTGTEVFVFGYDSSTDGSIANYYTAYYDEPSGAYLAFFHDLKHLGRSDHAGLRAALAEAVNLDVDFGNAQRAATSLGLTTQAA